MTETRTVEIGGQQRRVERVSARKASRALAILRHITGGVEELAKAWAQADRDYRETHVLKLSRVEARLRYPPSPLLDPDTRAPVREPQWVEQRNEAGELERVPNPRADELVTVPSPIDHMTEDDWRESGHALELKEAPSTMDLVPAVFERALELGESEVYRLMALFLMPNEEVKRRRRDDSLNDALSEQADDLVDDAYADELLELAVVCGELVDDQFVGKARALGERAGNAFRLFGLDPERLRRTPTNGPTSSTPSSSTDGPTDSDGPPTKSSTQNGHSSDDSATSTSSEPSSSELTNRHE